MSLRLQILLLISATVSALRPAHFARQFETCGVACGGGWCCAEFESCVASPGNTVDGGWGCIFQGVSNDDGSPITDEPFNPSADAAQFNSISDIISQQFSFISSLTSALSITSLSISSITSLPSAGFTAPTVALSTSKTPAAASTPGTSSSAPLASVVTSPTAAASSKFSTTSSPASLPSSITSSPKISISSTIAGASPSSNNSSTTSSIVLTSDTNRGYYGYGNTVALVLCFLSAAVAVYLV